MRVLITGATGLVGSKITQICHQRGLEINYLTTSKKKIQKKQHYQGFYWNPSEGKIDTNALEGVGAIINLAGENIFKPWTRSNKRKILNSRLDSLNLLYNTLRDHDHEVGQIVTASGISVYPSSSQKMYDEQEQDQADTFLGQMVVEWERAADRFSSLGLRVAKIRLGIILASRGGALEQMQRPLRYNLGTALGDGLQWQSWIHILDVARMFIYVMEQGLIGVYNGVAPNPVTNEDLVKAIAQIMNKNIWLPKVPALLLKMVMGELAGVVLSSHLVSSKKIQSTGFTFSYVNLRPAVEDLLNKKTGH